MRIGSRMSSEINCQKEMEKVTLCCPVWGVLTLCCLVWGVLTLCCPVWGVMRLFFVVSVSGIKLVSLWYSKSSESYCLKTARPLPNYRLLHNITFCADQDNWLSRKLSSISSFCPNAKVVGNIHKFSRTFMMEG